MMKSLRVLSACAVLSFCVGPPRRHPESLKRINRAIELLSQGQPVYYTGSHEGTDGNFEQGGEGRARPMPTTSATTWSTRPFDVRVWPTTCAGWSRADRPRSGPQEPPAGDRERAGEMAPMESHRARPNAWMFQAGAGPPESTASCCATPDAPGAVRAFVEAVRFPGYGGAGRGVHGQLDGGADLGHLRPDEYGEKGGRLGRSTRTASCCSA